MRLPHLPMWVASFVGGAREAFWHYGADRSASDTGLAAWACSVLHIYVLIRGRGREMLPV
jgi:hypothetical protein